MLLTEQLLKSSNKSASAYLTIYTSVNIIVCFNFFKKKIWLAYLESTYALIL